MATTGSLLSIMPPDWAAFNQHHKARTRVCTPRHLTFGFINPTHMCLKAGRIGQSFRHIHRDNPVKQNLDTRALNGLDIIQLSRQMI